MISFDLQLVMVQTNISTWLRIKTLGIILLCSALVFQFDEVCAQLLVDKVIPMGPNTAALMKYCDHPQKKNTGIPRIKIPLHTIVYKDIMVPITLEYHTLGIRVEEESTWAGLGWYLSAGGVITRMVRGKNDLGISEQELGVKARGYPFELANPCLDDCPDKEQENFHDKVCDGEIDTDPDVFFFDILGRRGKFLLTPGHEMNKDTIMIQLKSPMKMTAIFHIKDNQWEVKDQRGYRYIFATREITESHRNYFDYKFESHKILFKYYSDRATTSWYLDQIISPKGNNLRLVYDVDSKGHSDYGFNSAHQKMNINDDDVWDVHYSSYCFPPEVENVQILSENLVNEVYLRSIRYGKYQVEFLKSERTDAVHPAIVNRPRPAGSEFSQYFESNKNPQKLDILEVFEVATLVKKVDFHYSYFNADTQDSIPRFFKRLRLDSLSFWERGKVKPAYEFTYREKYGLPSKESHARDLWGFFNGEEDYHNITPSDYYNYNQPENVFQHKNREKHYSIDHVKEGILSEIVSPFGRIETYVFEAQEYTAMSHGIDKYYDSKMVQTNFDHNTDPFTSGGLRIKEMVWVYPSDQIYREYNYITKEGSEGMLSATPFSHEHDIIGHKTAGNHHVWYDYVGIKSGKVHKGARF